MQNYLSRIEIAVCYLFYGILLTLALYKFTQIDYEDLPDYEYMSDGWDILDRKIDDYDAEWENWTTFIKTCWLFYIAHIAFGELKRLFKFKNPSLVFLSIGGYFIYHYFNFKFLMCLVLQLFTYFFAAKMYNKYCVWTLGLFWLFVINLMKVESNSELASVIFNIKVTKVHQMLIIMAWMMLKGISFGLENVEFLQKHLRDDVNFSLINFLGYSLYFPTILFGPNMVYSRYVNMLKFKSTENFEKKAQRFLKLTINIARYAFWYFFAAFCLHYFYIHSVQYNTDLLKTLDTLSFYGLGYLMGQFFHIKYTIFYGIGNTLGNFDRIEMPDKPKCICRIHRYIDMWKYFDCGLYEFLFKYIYSSMCPKTASWKLKLASGFCTFFFIYLWHGFFDFILIWSAMNCVCVVLEKCVYSFLNSNRYKTIIKRVFKSNTMIYRVNAFISSHILIPSIISNFFFFGGKEVGEEFIHRTYFGGLGNYLKISICITLLYPTAEFIRRYEINKYQQKNITTRQ